MTPQTDEAVRSLIERLEKATGPSRLIDNAIHDYLKPERFAALEYTASIDAALTLVPDRFTWSVDSQERVLEFPDGYFWATVHGPSAFTHEHWRATAPTPALALCIAAMKARLAQRENGYETRS